MKRNYCRTCNEPTHIMSTFCRFHQVMHHAATMNVRYHTLKDQGRKPTGPEIEREYQRRVAMPNGNKVGYILKNAQQPDGLRRKVIPPSMIQWSSPEKLVRLIERKGFVMGAVTTPQT